MNEEVLESRVEIKVEKRKSYFNIRFVPEVEIKPDVWVKLNNSIHMKSHDVYMFQLQDEKTNEMVNLQLHLDHTETVTKEISTYSNEDEK